MNKKILKKEKIIQDYCKKRNWNPNELTINQMLIIVKQKEYYDI